MTGKPTLKKVSKNKEQIPATHDIVITKGYLFLTFILQFFNLAKVVAIVGGAVWGLSYISNMVIAFAGQKTNVLLGLMGDFAIDKGAFIIVLTFAFNGWRVERKIRKNVEMEYETLVVENNKALPMSSNTPQGRVVGQDYEK